MEEMSRREAEARTVVERQKQRRRRVTPSATAGHNAQYNTAEDVNRAARRALRWLRNKSRGGTVKPPAHIKEKILLLKVQ